MRIKYGEILKMGWGPAHEGARFEGDDPPEMKSWLRHWTYLQVENIYTYFLFQSLVGQGLTGEKVD